MDILKDIRCIIVHHTERDRDFPRFTRFRHKYIRFWDDVGYHFLIGNCRFFSEDGMLYLGRPELYWGGPYSRI